MTSFCDMQPHGDQFRCGRCGTIRGVYVVRKCDGEPCPHLGQQRTDSTGIPIKVSCGCQGKEREVLMAVHTCELHKRCLPTARLNETQLETWSERHESGLYMLCQICKENPQISGINS